jgi:predicted membrane protein DUF2142
MNTGFRAVLNALTGTSRRLFLSAFAVFFALSASWSLASPLGSAPDDPAHMIKAAATARGEINGVPGYIEAGGLQPVRYYNVPASYAALESADSALLCYAFHPETPASCGHSDLHATGLVSVPTTAGHYNPIYYAAVGWPSLFAPGATGMYLMRLVSALLCSLMLAAAVFLAAQWRRPAFPLLGVSCAATPMVLFLDGMVTPNAPEASSAVLAWTAALSITMDPRPELLKRRLTLLAIGLAVLANVRPLGAEWIAAILAVALIVKRRGALAGMLRSRAVWVAAAVTAVAGLFGVGWSVTHGDSAKVPYQPNFAFRPAAHFTLSVTEGYIKGLVGVFGWLDTPSPAITYYFWLGVITLMMVIAWACGRLLQGLAVLGLLAGVIFIPVVAQGIEAKHVGYIWQGRYLLAFAVGLPILAGAVISQRGIQIPSAFQRRIVVVALLLLAFSDFAAYFHAMRRYVVGLGKSLILRHAHWEPPGTWPLLLLLYAVALAAFLVLMIAASGGRDEADPSPDHGESAPEEAAVEVAVPNGFQSPRLPRIGAL